MKTKHALPITGRCPKREDGSPVSRDSQIAAISYQVGGNWKWVKGKGNLPEEDHWQHDVKVEDNDTSMLLHNNTHHHRLQIGEPCVFPSTSQPSVLDLKFYITHDRRGDNPILRFELIIIRDDDMSVRNDRITKATAESVRNAKLSKLVLDTARAGVNGLGDLTSWDQWSKVRGLVNPDWLTYEQKTRYEGWQLDALWFALQVGNLYTGRAALDVHVFSNVDVYLDWPAKSGDRQLQTIRTVLDKMNGLLYGAVDGQLRIRQFTLYSGKEKRGSIHFHKTWPPKPEPDPKQEHPARFTGWVPEWKSAKPDKPVDSHLSYEGAARAGPGPYEYVALMEFLHAYFSLDDEYLGLDGKISNGKCPDNNEKACPMDGNTNVRPALPDMTRLCGPDIWAEYAHSRNNLQEQRWGKSCYETVAEQIRNSFRKKMVVPRKPFPERPMPLQAKWNVKF